MVLVKGLLLLLFASVASLTPFPVIHEDDDKLTAAVKKVLQTWDPKKEVTISDRVWSRGESKRFNQSVPLASTLVSVPNAAVNQYCTMPGYTGANCEFPICESTNPDCEAEQPGLNGVMTDALMLTSCSGSMTTVLDKDMAEITIMIEADRRVNPRVALFNPDGVQVMPQNEIINAAGLADEVHFMPQEPGTYTIQGSAQTPIDDAKCFVIVRAITPLLTRGAFVLHNQTFPPDRNDFPQADAVAGQPTTLVVHATGLLSPGSLVSVTIFEDFNVMSRPQSLLIRYNCGFEYFIENFYCTDTSELYYYRVDGIDFWGNKFSRIGMFSCLPAPITTPVPSPTSDPGPKSCVHGGYLMTNKDGTTYCYCQGLWTGRNCGTIVCMNGGTNNGLVCSCPPGFSGTNCQDVKCISRSGYGFITGHPRLVLVVRWKTSMNAVINQLITQVTNIYNYLEASEPGYLHYFGLVLFNNKKIINAFATSNFQDIIGTLNNATKQTQGDCSDSVFTGVEEALNFALPNGSPIYVFTDAVPSDELEFETIFHLTTYWRAPIYVTLIEPPASSGCSLDLYHTSYLKLNEMTKRTSGHLFYLSNDTATAAGRVFFAHMLHVFHRSSLVHSYDAAQCRYQPQYQPISVDKRLNELVITATGKGLTLTTVLPDGTSVKQTETYSKSDIYFWSISNPMIGQWMLSLKSSTDTTECNYRVYSTQTRSGQRQEYDLFWSFTPGLMWDGPLPQPLENEPLGLVAQMNNYNLLDASKVFAELIVYKQAATGRENVFASNGIWRDQCDYKFYFPPMVCTIDDELLYFSIFVRDELGTMIQRGGIAFCSKGMPTMSPPTDCQNGGVMINANDTNCYCTPDWTGSKCEQIICQNGGTASQTSGASWCQCPVGHTGKYCQIVSCLAEGAGEEFSPVNRDLAFVVDLTTYGAQSMLALKNFISTLMRDISLHHPEWIANYVLVGYNSTWESVLAHTRRGENARFVRAVSDAFDQLTADMDTNCVSHLYYALAEALDYVRQDSYIVVLHASAPQVLDTVAYRAYNLIVDKRAIVNAYYAYSQKSNGTELRCNTTMNDYLFMTAMAEVNQGRAYPVENSNFHLVLPMIPSFYLSGMVYKKRQADCTTGPMYVYFPIDAYTQSIQLNVIGYSNQLTMYNPDGDAVPVPFDYIDDMTQTGWRVAEFRKECDYQEGWESTGPHYCIKFILNPTDSWQNASTFCHRFNGFLVDELNQEMGDYITSEQYNTPIWIGLYRRGDNFLWDTAPGNQPIPLDPAYQNWDTNEPSTDKTKNCVMRTGPGKWKMEDCSAIHAYICEKHKYDPTFEPTGLQDETLIPGKWYVTVNTTATPADYPFPLSGCEVEVRVQSSLQVFPEYVLDEHADVSNGDATSGSDKNRFITYLYDGEKGSSAAVLKYANLYVYDNMSMQAAATYERRAECTYPWLSQTWSCPDYENINNRFAVIHSGEDQTGQTFQRITSGHCARPRTSCANGGVVYGGLCVCQDYWQGATCDTPMCVNNGTLNQASKTCLCNQGYAGFACQYDTCLPQVPANFTTNQKTFGLIVEMTAPNKAAVQQLASGIANLVTLINQKNKMWFQNAMLVTINSTSDITATSYSLSDFVAAVQKLPDQITDPGTVCGAPLYTGIVRSLQSTSFAIPRSPIFIITRSTLNDLSMNDGDFVTSMISEAKPQIYYIGVDDTEKICGKTADHPDVERLSGFALASGGNFFVLPINNLVQFLQAYIPTLYMSTLVTTPAITDNQCKDVQWFAQVDSYMTSLYISTFTTIGALAVLDPSNDIMPLEVLYSNKKTRYLKVDTEGKPGMYTVRMNAPTHCFAQVRGVSPVTVWVGYVWLRGGPDETPTHTDQPNPYPITKVDNVLIFHMEGVQTWQGILTYAELVNPYNNTVLVTPLYKRQGCSYEYYSETFKCPDVRFLVLISGMDDKGQNFRREVALADCMDITNAQAASEQNEQRLWVPNPVKLIDM